MPDRRNVCAIAIVAKECRPGLSKTRLSPPLTPSEAASLSSRFLLDTADNIVAAGERADIQGFVAYHPAGAAAFFRDLLPPAIELLPPREAGLGPSLLHGCRDLLALGYGAACIVNSDSPTLPSIYLAAAAHLLARPGDRVVLGPSADGGYYLVGVKQPHRRLFEDIAWSTDLVLKQTLERASEIGVAVELLPEWYDVDDAASLGRLCEELAGGRRGARHTAAYLKALACGTKARQDLARLLEPVV
jgi:rSAM/selenodomain-associated transferase 1